FFFSSRRRHTRSLRDWSSDVCSSDLKPALSDAVPRTVIVRLTNSTITVLGTASDNAGLARVEYQLGNGAFQRASGTTNWLAQIALAPGTNAFTVRSVDLSGNVSAPVNRQFTYVVVSPLTVTVSGNGQVTPNLNGQSLEVGQPYTMVASPALGNMF